MHIPRGIASTASDLGFITDVGGYPQLIRLSTGERLASAEQPAEPIAIVRDMAISWRCEAASLLVFSASPKAGSLRNRWTARIALPDWVVEAGGGPSVDGRETLRVEVATRIIADQLSVWWSASAFYRGGAPPGDAVAAQVEQRDDGGAQIALEDGTLITEPVAEPPLQGVAKLPVRPLAGHKLHPYRRGARFETTPWHYGNNDYYLKRPAAGVGIALYRRGHHGEGVEELISDSDAEASVSEDGRLLFVHTAQSKDPWIVFDVETNRRIGQVPYDPHTVELTLLGERLLALVEETVTGERRLELRCRAADGTLTWSLDLGREQLQAAPTPLPR